MFNKKHARAIRYLALNVGVDDCSVDFSLAIDTAGYYATSEKKTVRIVKETSTSVKENWERPAADYGISRGNIGKMRPAFSACYEY